MEQKTKIVQPRAFNTLTVDEKNGTITKRSTEVAKFIDEINWYEIVPKAARSFIPKVYATSTDGSNSYIKMELLRMDNLHDLYVNKKMSLAQFQQCFNKIKDMLSVFAKSYSKSPNTYLNRYEIYVTKTIERISKLYSNPKFLPFFINQIKINGKKYPPLGAIILDVLKYALKLLVNNDKFCFVHGDLFPANMMYDIKNQQVKVFDPRGRFGDDTFGGDIVYEYAKLLHSFEGHYDWIVEDKFKVKSHGSIINYSFTFDTKYVNDVKNLFKKYIPKDLKLKVQLAESMLFLTMVPLHYDYYSRQLVQLATGIELFYLFLKEYNNSK